MDRNRKKGRYDRLIIQIEDLLGKCDDMQAHMATITAVLFNKMDHFYWCGFYRIVNGDLTVGPYQGPLACQVLQKNKGVCWAAVNQKKTIIVPDVHLFPGHIACDPRSRSEIVVPVFDKNDKVIAVLDVDSKDLNSFDDLDAIYLEKIVLMLNTDSAWLT